MLEKLFLKKNHTFIDVVYILNNLLLILGINRYSFTIDLETADVRFNISKKSFYYTIFLRTFAFVVSLFNLYFHKYNFENLNELLFIVLDITYVLTGVGAPFLSYLSEKKYLIIVKSLTKLNKQLCDCKKLDKDTNYSLIITIIKCAIFIMFICFGLSVYLDISITSDITPTGIALFFSYYMFYFYINGIITIYIVVLCFLQLWFKKINKFLSVQKRHKSDVVLTVLEIHNEAMEVFNMICKTFTPQFVFVFTTNYLLLIIVAYSFIKMRIFGLTVTSIVRLLYYMYVIFQTFVIVWFTQTASDEVIIQA